MIAYLLEFSSLLALFGLVYLVFLRNAAAYKFLRDYILGSIVISVLLPFAPALLQNKVLSYGIVLPELTIFNTGTPSITVPVLEQASTIPWGTIIFALISFVITIRLIFAISKIALIIIHSDKRKISDVTVHISSRVHNAFSFFHYVVLPLDFFQEGKDLGPIVKHEKLHIAFDHSIEKLFLEITKCILWWHPVIWLYRRELELIHEYQVDHAMVDQMNKREYKKLLLHLALQPSAIHLVNPISSNIIKRIKMMNQEKKKSNLLKGIPVFAFLIFGSLFIHSCQKDDVYPSLDPVTDISSKENIKQSEDGQTSFEIERIDTMTIFDYDTYEESVEIITTKETIYKKPNQMPVFPGCDSSLSESALSDCSNLNLLQFIYKNVTYPKDAKDNEIEGTVVVQFIIDEYGHIGRTEFIRSLGGGIEREVERLMNKLQKEIKWVPGKHLGKNVSVQYTLPIKFKLKG